MLIEILLIAAQFLLLGAILAYIFWSTARGISGYMDVPFVPTRHKMLPIIAEALQIGAGDIVYDLGCGDGRVLFYCAKLYPDAKFIGVERNPLLLAFMYIKRFVTHATNVEIRGGNIFVADFSDASRIYVFLLPDIMEELAPKLHAPLVASRAFLIPGRREAKILELSKKPDKWNKHLLYIYTE